MEPIPTKAEAPWRPYADFLAPLAAAAPFRAKFHRWGDDACYVNVPGVRAVAFVRETAAREYRFVTFSGFGLLEERAFGPCNPPDLHAAFDAAFLRSVAQTDIPVLEASDSERRAVHIA